MKDLSDASFVLGIQIHRNRWRYSWIITKEVFKNGSQEIWHTSLQSGDTPLAKGDKFSFNQCSKSNFEGKKYRRFLMFQQ